MNIEEILAGNFSSIAGTWRNDYQEELIFEDQGIVSEDFQVLFEEPLVEAGFLTTHYSPILSLAGGALIRFIPAGVDASTPDVLDRSKHFKDRIWISQTNGDLAFARKFFYKVD